MNERVHHPPRLVLLKRPILELQELLPLDFIHFSKAEDVRLFVCIQKFHKLKNQKNPSKNSQIAEVLTRSSNVVEILLSPTCVSSAVIPFLASTKQTTRWR